MSRKATPPRAARSASRKKTTKPAAKAKPAKKASRTTAGRGAPAGKSARKTTTQATTKVAPRSTSRRGSSSVKGGSSPVDILNRAEADITSAIEVLNNQMNAALVPVPELAS